MWPMIITLVHLLWTYLPQITTCLKFATTLATFAMTVAALTRQTRRWWHCRRQASPR